MTLVAPSPEEVSSASRPIDIGRIGRTVAWAGLIMVPLCAAVVQREPLADYSHHILAGETDQETAIGAALSTVAGQRIIVRCHNPDNSARLAQTYDVPLLPSMIRIRPDICAWLEEFMAGPNSGPDRWRDYFTSLALQTAAHELSHQIGEGDGRYVRDEGRVECYALQRVDDVAQAMGAGGETAARLAQQAAAEFVAANEESAPPPDCVNGGPYDLDPANALGYFPLGR